VSRDRTDGALHRARQFWSTILALMLRFPKLGASARSAIECLSAKLGALLSRRRISGDAVHAGMNRSLDGLIDAGTLRKTVFSFALDAYGRATVNIGLRLQRLIAEGKLSAADKRSLRCKLVRSNATSRSRGPLRRSSGQLAARGSARRTAVK
jgi:hypothetical protein